ncbi:matrixin family metalloprotease [Kribbella sp. NPDC048915]|uniref:matrixin family metalloprotease n=1 Tax=Kribbella sp. NPDC048915 TaxID=3155148 RepID=UPI0033F284CB
MGLTSWKPGTQGPVTVKLNDHYKLTANQRRTVACHELGHALSLDHATSTSSCMYSGKYISLHPSKHDYGLLPRIYPKPGT